MTQYLDLADYLLIAEEVLGVRAETIARWPGIGLAASALGAPAMGYAGADLHPDLIDKAAVLCVRLARNHPYRMATSASPTSPCWSFWPGTRSTGRLHPSTRRSRPSRAWPPVG